MKVRLKPCLSENTSSLRYYIQYKTGIFWRTLKKEITGYYGPAVIKQDFSKEEAEAKIAELEQTYNFVKKVKYDTDRRNQKSNERHKR